MTRRRSRRGFERRLAAVESAGSRSEYPEAHLITVMSADSLSYPDVDGREDLITCDGEIYRMAKHVRDALAAQGER